MKIDKYILVSIMCSIILSSCNVMEDNTEIVVDIRSDFQAELGEVLLPDRRALTLNLKTLENIPCESAYLNYRVDTSATTINVELVGINKPLGCNAGVTEPVEAEILLNKKEIGTYSLNIELLNSFENNGTLIINEDRYQLILENNKGFQVQFKTLRKTPEELFWGFLASDTGADLEAKFTGMRLRLGNSVEYAPITTGTYNDFFIGDDGVINLRSPQDFSDIRPFYFNSRGDREDVTALIESFKSQLSDDIQAFFYSGRGETF